MNEIVIANYQLGNVLERFNKDGVEYARISLSSGKGEMVANSVDAIPLNKFLDFAKQAGLDICWNCHGTGKVNPIENPPYKCDKCNGKGYTVFSD
jgi:hypothetical protein